ncbi:MAG: DNA primase [bacterium]|nr:DNA primase [bacterium]
MDNQVEEIKNRLDIVEVVQEYLQLTRAGTNHRALCPFHGEKTPSFMVSQDKQIWHCFGCGEGGDVLSFIMKIEGVEFPEALRLLATKAGVQLEVRNPELANKKTGLLEIHRLAAAYFHKILLDSSQAEQARAYLLKRNISETTIDQFQLGYSVDSWDALLNFLKKKGYDEDVIFDAGLSVKKDRGEGSYDRFRGRLMFPLADAHGQVVGFSGRTLKPDEKTAKYVNTPQTAIYNKSALLYTLHKAKSVIQKTKLAVVVEGQMDALASHQAGVENVVASGGTALTQEQVKLIKRYCSTVAFAFDMDPAGAEAVKRGLEVAWQYELETKVIVLPFGKDPDECIQQDSEAWKKAISEARPFLDYYFDKVFQDHDQTAVEGKKKAAVLLLPMIARLPNQIEQTHYLQKLAAMIKVEEHYLREQISRSRPSGPKTETPATSAARPAHDRVREVAEMVLGIGLQYPNHLDYLMSRMESDNFTDAELSELYKRLIVFYTESTRFSLKDFFAYLSQHDTKGQLSQLAKRLCLRVEAEFSELTADDPAVIKKTLIDAIPFLKKSRITGEIGRLQKTLAEAEQTRDQERIRSLSEQITRLTEDIRQLNQ